MCLLYWTGWHRTAYFIYNKPANISFSGSGEEIVRVFRLQIRGDNKGQHAWLVVELQYKWSPDEVVNIQYSRSNSLFHTLLWILLQLFQKPFRA